MDSVKTRILDILEREKRSMNVVELSEQIPEWTDSSVQGGARELYLNGLLDRMGSKREYRYFIPEKIEIIARGFVTEKEIERTKERAVPGTAVKFKDEDGETQTTKVKKKYPHHCLMTNGHSYTWAQMALFFRNRRLPIW